MPPKQLTSPELSTEIVGPFVVLMVTDASSEQPKASVIVTVYDPGARLFAVIPEPPDGDHE